MEDTFNITKVMEKLKENQELWTKHDQGQVFRWCPQLNPKESEQLLEDLEQIDVCEVNKVYQTTIIREAQNYKPDVKPFPSVMKIENVRSEQREKWREIGYQLISEGKVGILLLAGGQATRLGCTFPKGIYDIGLPSGKSLYQIQVERSITLQKLAFKHTGKESHIVWYIMTSPATYADTIAFFQSKNFFDLPETNFFFFNQHMLPCIQPDGKIINSSGGRVAVAPNGNGGLYKALHTSGALEDMKKRGVEYIAQYCVDNALIRVADPVFLGFMHEQGADCAAKVLPKAFPEEPVGVMCLYDGKPAVIEYSEIDPALRSLRDPNTNQLVYNYAHICINNFTREFLKRMIDNNHVDELRYHVAKKKIPCADNNGATVTPTKENGWKLELFIFDAFQFSNKMVLFEVSREDEFSPLKNAAGMAVPKDSPETCLKDVDHLHHRYVRDAGGEIEGDGLVEVSPLLSYCGEGLEDLKGKTFKAPVEIGK